MEKIHIGILGLLAGACTTVSFLPQVIKILKTRKAGDISLYMYIILTTGVFLWMVYGIFLREIPIILANGVTLVLCVLVLAMKIKYGKRG
ncbi:MAG: SemiSWEET transporter [Candidatus Omnitrophota bacterium]|nr:SemiSWEET transporter [Candidatus Omnitrophota bacterium]